jgi:hypothetical protein
MFEGFSETGRGQNRFKLKTEKKESAMNKRLTVLLTLIAVLVLALAVASVASAHHEDKCPPGQQMETIMVIVEKCEWKLVPINHFPWVEGKKVCEEVQVPKQVCVPKPPPPKPTPKPTPVPVNPHEDIAGCGQLAMAYPGDYQERFPKCAGYVPPGAGAGLQGIWVNNFVALTGT